MMVISDDLKARAEMIGGYLYEHKGNFFKAKELAKFASLPTSGTQEKVRECVTWLIEEGGQPIVSNGSGFTYATCANMVANYHHSLNERLMGLKRRITAVGKIYHEMSSGEQGKPAFSGLLCPRCGQDVEATYTLCRFCRAQEIINK